MVLVNIDLENFRNYDKATLSFSSGYNILIGANAQGKTNLLEAVFTLCLTKSFRTNYDSELIKFGSSSFRLSGEFKSDLETKRAVAVGFGKGKGKEVHLDRKKVARSSHVIGQFPVVIFSPSDYPVTLGGPAERRRFVDTLLAQSSVKYLKNLQAYLRIVRQRNKILLRIRFGEKVPDSLLSPWNLSLIERGSEVVSARVRFMEEFNPVLQEKYSLFTGSTSKLTLHYSPSISEITTTSIRDSFNKALTDLRTKERARGITQVGPHRDDFAFHLNGVELRRYGSRGEHKSALLACKLAELDFLGMLRRETPILLLDDVFSELDAQRRECIWDSLKGAGQVLISATDSMAFADRVPLKLHRINNGQVYVNG